MNSLYNTCVETNEKCIELLKKSTTTLPTNGNENVLRELKNLIELYQINAKLLKAKNRFTSKHCAYCIQETENFLVNQGSNKRLRSLNFMLRKLIKDCEKVLQTANRNNFEKAV
ncbi:hypothetical protein HX109_11415 [Galbibacter sp. BG1]|uniref:hypothetical protein n=1 Tax=Galbibacter sp. BG1 TaxID=1170699 RepID=UPI0015B86885|nr:hypothetical protein [Galbibacter sp. BG1]QLE02130.1 hypothetical protein HX109_11415 [Galbibacter sp. BG1]